MAAGRIVLPPYFPARDRNARLVPGALLAVYVDNTTTKALIYSDQALTTPLTNPVPANSSGHFPAIWCDAGTTEAPVLYSLAISDADGRSIGNPAYFTGWQPSVDAESAQTALAEAAAEAAQGYYEDILALEGIADPSIAIATRAAKAANLSDLADRTAAFGNLNYLSAIPGAVVRTAAAKAGDFLTTADRNLAGDGTTDDTAALQAAITYAASVGKPLHILPAASYYKITAALTVPDNATLIGSGWKSRIVQATADTDVLAATGDNITIDGVAVQGLNDTGRGITVLGGENATVRGCLVKNCLRGIQVTGTSRNVLIEGNKLWGGAGNGSFAADIGCYGSSSSVRRVVIANNLCLSNNDVGISADNNSGDREVVITGNIIVPCDADGVSERTANNSVMLRFGINVGYNGGFETRAVVSGNLVRRAGYIGVYVQGAAAPSGTAAISGNMISECGFSTLYDPSDASLKGGIFLADDGANSITGNVIVDCTGSGLKVAPALGKSADATRSTVTGNTIGRTIGRGIWCTNKMSGYTFSGNRIFGGTGQPAIEWTSTEPATGGDCLFIGNHVETTGANGAFQITAVGLASPVVVRDNKCLGDDSATSSAFNSGVWFSGVSGQDVVIDGNTFETYNRGVNANTAVTGRNLAGPKNNHMIDCALGLASSGAGTLLCQGNTFTGVTAPVSGSSCVGIVLCGVFGTDPQMITGNFDGSAPLYGTYARGDQCLNPLPTAGGVPGWVCVTSGAPGTWKAMAAIAA